jgi:hypothetical protein
MKTTTVVGCKQKKNKQETKVKKRIISCVVRLRLKKEEN